MLQQLLEWTMKGRILVAAVLGSTKTITWKQCSVRAAKEYT